MKEHVRIMLTEEEVNRRIEEVAQQINKDFDGKPLHLICILKGGAMFIHSTTTPVIEVADDLKTARAVFLSPGFEGIAAKKMGTWANSKYAYEFIFEDGEWKVWKCRIFPVFRNDYFDDFGAVAEEDMTKKKRVGMEDFHEFFRYGPDVIMPRNEPDPPRPYDTWEPGWNFGTD